MADAKTMGKWGLAVGPDVIKQIHDHQTSLRAESSTRRMLQTIQRAPQTIAAFGMNKQPS
jgi:hypothetical protein